MSKFRKLTLSVGMPAVSMGPSETGGTAGGPPPKWSRHIAATRLHGGRAAPPERQRDHEQNQEEKEQDAGDVGGGGVNDAEPEHARDQGDHQEHQGPAQHGGSPEVRGWSAPRKYTRPFEKQTMCRSGTRFTTPCRWPGGGEDIPHSASLLVRSPPDPDGPWSRALRRLKLNA